MRLLLALALAAALSTAPAAAQPPQPEGGGAPPHDPHSYSRPEEVRVEHLALDLDVDFVRKQLTGTATLRLQNRAGAKTVVLDTHGLDIRGVTRQPGGGEAAFTLGKPDPILGRPIEIQIAPDTTSVTVSYSSAP
ncbi:MAG: aminopeptidase, partial [Acidobacteria bacterium]